MQPRRILPLAAFWCPFFWGPLVVLHLSCPVPAAAGEASILLDIVERFPESRVTGTRDASASDHESCGGKRLPAVFLHPPASGAAKLILPAVGLPAAPGARPVLVFGYGFRDGVPWDGDGRGANGVRFSVRIDGERVFARDHRGPIPGACAIDLSRWSGKAATVSFQTEAIDGNSSYDWALLIRPRVVAFPAEASTEPLPSETAGLALVRLRCAEPSTVQLDVGGELASELALPTGEHEVPVWFPAAGLVSVKSASHPVELVATRVAALASRLVVEELFLSSPLLRAGEPWELVVRMRNRGLGSYSPARDSPGNVAVAAVGPGLSARTSFSPPRMAPNEAWTYRWRGDPFTESGEATFSCDEQQVLAHVFDLPPELDDGSLGDDVTRPKSVQRRDGGGFRATLRTHGARLDILSEAGGESYAVARVHDGRELVCAATLSPLARLSAKVDGTAVELRWRMRAVEDDEAGVTLLGEFVHDDHRLANASLRLLPSRDAARIALSYRVECLRGIELLAFWGPDVFVGDRSFGARRDFALFAGLEYLEGEEHSSSTRDLVWPLSDRRVPAVHKLTAPLMAVQSQDVLVSLIWDPRQQWTARRRHVAAHFLAPEPGTSIDATRLALFVPPVGEHLRENTFQADPPIELARGEKLRLDATLVLDHARNYGDASIVAGPQRGGLVLQAFRHLFDLTGLPEPSPSPRRWSEERELSRHAYFQQLWSEDPPGFSHCKGWSKGLLVGHAVPLILDRRDQVSAAVGAEIDRRLDKLLRHAVETRGGGNLWSGAGCHILLGELPYFYGFVGESLKNLRQHAEAVLAQRKDGLWRWYPSTERHATLGEAGGHTLGTAARSAWLTLRAARLAGDRDLARRALEALRQLERYEVPRGAQMWECPLYQPDILAAAYAIRAYCEAYRLDGNPEHVSRARYWAWSGLPFLYLWELEGYPTMRYNVIAVIGSTFHTHSWLGLPVVWCGLVYAYALQDLALFDDSFQWRTIARGILRSAQWQQYADGPSKGCYPDTWSMTDNAPRPADINPENILVNGYRLRGDLSPEIRHRRIPGLGGDVHFNTTLDIRRLEGSPAGGELAVELDGAKGFSAFASLAPVAKPSEVSVPSARSSDDLQDMDSGWIYDADLRAVILKWTPPGAVAEIRLRW